MREVETTQKLLVKSQTVLIVIIAARDKTIPDAFLRTDFRAQTIIIIFLIADKTNGLNLGHIAFLNFKNQIDAILIQLDNFGIDIDGKTSVTTIDLIEAHHIALNACTREHLAWTQLHFSLQLFIIQTIIPFKSNAIDDWVFFNLNNQSRALLAQCHIGK